MQFFILHLQELTSKIRMCLKHMGKVLRLVMTKHHLSFCVIQAELANLPNLPNIY